MTAGSLVSFDPGVKLLAASVPLLNRHKFHSSGAPQQVLAGFLHSFLDSSRTAAPFPAVKLPELGLSQMDKERIRNRSSIMARHIFADKGQMFVENQVRLMVTTHQFVGLDLLLLTDISS